MKMIVDKLFSLLEEMIWSEGVCFALLDIYVKIIYQNKQYYNGETVNDKYMLSNLYIKI